MVLLQPPGGDQRGVDDLVERARDAQAVELLGGLPASADGLVADEGHLLAGRPQPGERLGRARQQVVAKVERAVQIEDEALGALDQSAELVGV